MFYSYVVRDSLFFTFGVEESLCCWTLGLGLVKSMVCRSLVAGFLLVWVVYGC